MTTLNRWMEENGVSDETLAAAVDVDRSSISRVRRGKLPPSRRLIGDLVAYSIEAVKRGDANWHLRADDFFDLPDLPHTENPLPLRLGQCPST